MPKFRTSFCAFTLAIAFAACAQSQTGIGPEGNVDASIDGNAGTDGASGGNAGAASGGAAGNASGGTGGSAGVAGNAGAAGGLGDDGGDAEPVDAQPDGLVNEPGLVGFWRFEEAGGPVFDISGNGLHGSASGNVVRGVAGKVGNAIEFSGTDGSVKIVSSPKLDFSSGATIEFWINLSASTQGTILSRGTGNNDNHVRIKTIQGNVNVAFGRAGLGTSTAITGTNVLGNSWTHVAVTNDNVTLKVYVNGKIATSDVGGNLGSISADLYIGKSAASDFAINGSLDEVKWYTSVKTDQDICGDAGGTWANGEAGFSCQ